MNPRLKILFYVTAIICVASIVLNVFQAFSTVKGSDEIQGTESTFVGKLKSKVDQLEKKNERLQTERDSIKRASDNVIKN